MAAIDQHTAVYASCSVVGPAQVSVMLQIELVDKCPQPYVFFWTKGLSRMRTIENMQQWGEGVFATTMLN